MNHLPIIIAHFLMCVFLFSYTSSHSTPQSVKRLGLKQGLSQSTVYSIVQDQVGNIWFGTADGISIYDGYSFKYLRHDPNDPKSLSGNYVRSLLVDRNGDIWIGTLGGGLNKYNNKTKEITNYRADTKGNSLPSDDIYSLYQSSDGHLWIGSVSGVTSYNPENSTFKNYKHTSTDQNSLVKGTIRAITQTHDRLLWFGSEGYGLNSFDPSSKKFTTYVHQKDNATSLSDNSINALHQGRDGNLWIGTEYGGLDMLDLASGGFSHYQKHQEQPNGFNDTEVTSILEDAEGALWLGTWSGGLNRFDTENKTFTHFTNSPTNTASLSSNTIISLFVDHSGMLWLGSFDQGANVMVLRGDFFSHYPFDLLHENWLVNQMIWSFAEDKKQNIWVGTKGGLNKFNAENDTFTSYLAKGKCQGTTDSLDVRAILAKESFLWLGTAGGGLIQFYPDTCETRIFKNNEDDPTSLSNNNVRLLLEDSKGNIWAGTSGGLNKLLPHGNGFQRYPGEQEDPSALPHQRIRALYQDNEGNVWVGTSGGLSRYDSQTDAFTTITSKQGLLSDNDVRSVFQDPDGILWIATGGGLTRYNPKENNSIFFYEKDGLANDTLYSLLPIDDELWITTGNGLSHFNRKTFAFKNYHISDGLQSNEFNFNAYLKSTGGEMYIGGVNGFNRFYPRELANNLSAPQLQTEIIVGDGEISEKTSIIPDNTTVLRVSGPVNRMSFATSVFHYLNPAKNSFEYRLQGYEDKWLSQKATDKYVIYSGLPFGEYCFQVKAIASNGVTGDAVLSQKIQIKPPLWRSKPAYFLYSLLTAFLLFFALQLRTVALRRKGELLENSVKQKTLELQQSNAMLDNQARKLENLLKNQDDFYLRTAHELRTPLTLLRTPVEQLLQSEKETDKIKNLTIIQRAVFRLQRLTDQMLQAATHGYTHEAGVQSIDLTSVLAPLLNLYVSAAEKQSIKCIIEPLPTAAVSLNRNMLEDIIHNLLSNAIKYSRPGDTVKVRVSFEENNLLLLVQDSGIGINADTKNRLFDCHFREDKAKKGTIQGDGIGLYTVKQHIDACGGSLVVESEPEQGSTFLALLPCNRTEEQRAAVNSNIPESNFTNFAGPDKHDSAKKPCLLIIEDDRDMQQVLRSILTNQYQVIIADTVTQGLLQATEQNPAIILCDVMLPDGSGFDIVRILKKEDETSHIPIIVVTAIGDFPGQQIGWENGADDYVVKPFDSDELLLRISGLLNNRKRVQEWHQRKFFIGQNSINLAIAIDSSEIDYLTKLETESLKLLKARNCRLENLAESMGQSRRTLQRRLKSLLDSNFTQYIQSIQLKAAQRLLEQSCSVKETAYEVGFKDPAYFSKVFKNHFGISPRHYQQKTESSSK